MDRWQCTISTCRNREQFCYIDNDGKHYAITAHDTERWAGAITNGDATAENLPISLYNYWREQGAIGSKFKYPLAHQERQEKKDFIDTFMDFQKQSLQMRMAETMTESMERMSQRQQQQ